MIAFAWMQKTNWNGKKRSKNIIKKPLSGKSWWSLLLDHWRETKGRNKIEVSDAKST